MKDKEETGNIHERASGYDKVYTYADYLKFEIEELVEICPGQNIQTESSTQDRSSNDKF